MRSLVLFSVIVAATACSDTTAPDNHLLVPDTKASRTTGVIIDYVVPPQDSGIKLPDITAPKTPDSKFEPNSRVKLPQATGIIMEGIKAPHTKGIIVID